MSKTSTIESSIHDELIQKYNMAVPRYTSYPSAPYFESDYSNDDFLWDVKKTNEPLIPRDLSIYIHIPFCHSLCYFCGCNKIVTQQNHPKIDDYIDSLLKEISLRASLFDRDRRVTQIHFGGGTPNFLKNVRIAEILDKISSEFHLHLPSKLEMSIEIDPRFISVKDLFELAKIGFNRFSIGVQDFSKTVQLAVNRLQTEKATLDVIQAAKQVSQSVNVDLIIGLPKQNKASFRHTLEKVVDSGVTRIAAYNFAFLPNAIKAQKLINPSELPSSDERMVLMQMTRDYLLDSDFTHIGMDHFAKKGDSLLDALETDSLQRNFQGYTTHAQTDLVGLGVSAISHFQYAFSQNTTALNEYFHHIDSNVLPIVKGKSLSNEDVLRAEVIQQIMCRDSIDLKQLTRHFIHSQQSVSLGELFSTEVSELNSFVEDGLICLNGAHITITEKGRFFRRQIASIFDAYLQQHKSSVSLDTRKVIPFSQAL